MRKLFLLSLLALLGAPLAVTAQSGSQLVCFANDMHRLARVKISASDAAGREIPTGWADVHGRSRHCERFVRPHAVWFEVQTRNIGWEDVPSCRLGVLQPVGGVILRMAGRPLNLRCSFE